MNMKKLILTNLPYLLFAYPFDKLAQAFRLAPGADLSAKLLSIRDGFSMAFANAGGCVGGAFGPTLFLGAMAGFVLARTFNLLLAGTSYVVPEQNFVLVGMAGLMAGVMQAPMTAIFLIAEISGGDELLGPLLLTAAISYGAARAV